VLLLQAAACGTFLNTSSTLRQPPTRYEPTHHPINLITNSYDDDELAAAAGQRATQLLEAGGEGALAKLVPLIWAFGQQVCPCVRVCVCVCACARVFWGLRVVKGRLARSLFEGGCLVGASELFTKVCIKGSSFKYNLLGIVLNTVNLAHLNLL